MINLPVELYRDIVHQVDNETDLVSLLHVSSVLRVEAQRRLFRQIPGKFQAATAERIVLMWLESTSIGVIGKFIYRLDIEGMDERQTAVVERVTDAYDSLINLKELNLPILTSGSLIPSTTAPFQLLYFNSQTSLREVFESKLIPFFESQPGIRELDLFCDCDEPLSPNLLPNLSILSTKPTLAFALLPGRAVKCLFLYISNLPLPKKGIETFTSLRNLSLDTFESLDLYESSFPTLEFLELSIPSLDALKSRIAYIPYLRTLRLAAGRYNEENDGADIEKVFRASPSLQRIVVSQTIHWPSQGNAVDAWERGNSQPTRGIWQEHAWKEA